MILVVGATGHLGLAVCRRLAGATKRSGRSSARRRTRRSSTRSAAWGSTSRTAISRIGRAWTPHAATSTRSSRAPAQSAGRSSTTSRPSTRQGQRNLIDAATAARVDHFVFITLSGNMTTGSPLNEAKRTIEAAVRDSGMGYTVLRSSFFMEYWLSPLIGFDYPNHKATIFGAGENPITWITIDDVARSAAATVANRAARDQVIEIGGTRGPDPNEALSVFEGVMGPFEVQYVPEAALEATLAGTDDPHTRSVTALSLDFAHGDVVDTTRMTAALPFERTTVRRYVEGLPRG